MPGRESYGRGGSEVTDFRVKGSSGVTLRPREDAEKKVVLKPRGGSASASKRSSNDDVLKDLLDRKQKLDVAQKLRDKYFRELEKQEHDVRNFHSTLNLVEMITSPISMQRCQRGVRQ